MEMQPEKRQHQDVQRETRRRGAQRNEWQQEEISCAPEMDPKHQAEDSLGQKDPAVDA